MFDKSDEARFLEMLKNRVEEIRQNNNPKLLDPTRTHWKCKYLCHFAKNNWPGTDDKMCIHIEKHLKKTWYGENSKDCTRPGFNIASMKLRVVREREIKMLDFMFNRRDFLRIGSIGAGMTAVGLSDELCSKCSEWQ